MINAFGLLGECGCNFFLDSLAGVSNRNSKQQTFGVSKIVGAGLQDLLINKLGKDQYKISDSQLIVVTTRLKKKIHSFALLALIYCFHLKATATSSPPNTSSRTPQIPSQVTDCIPEQKKL